MQEARSLGLKEAEMICDYCIRKATESKNNKEVVGAGYPIGICVIDRHGTVLCHKVMDGCFSLAARLSRTKAQSALELLRDTKVQREICQSRGISLMPYEFSSVEHTEIPGGCVIRTSDENVVGAVGVSGRSPQGDEQMAQLGVECFKKSEEYQV